MDEVEVSVLSLLDCMRRLESYAIKRRHQVIRLKPVAFDDSRVFRCLTRSRRVAKSLQACSVLHNSNYLGHVAINMIGPSCVEGAPFGRTLSFNLRCHSYNVELCIQSYILSISHRQAGESQVYAFTHKGHIKSWPPRGPSRRSSSAASPNSFILSKHMR